MARVSGSSARRNHPAVNLLFDARHAHLGDSTTNRRVPHVQDALHLSGQSRYPYRQRAAGAGHSCPTSTGEVDEDAGRQPACDAGAADPGPAELVADHGRRFNDASSRRSITLKLEPISASP